MSPLKQLIIEALVIILILAGCFGSKVVTDYASRVFPLRMENIIAVFVTEETHTEGTSSHSSLEEKDMEAFLAALDQLQPIREDKPRERATEERRDIDYEVALCYSKESGLFRRTDIIHMYFRSDGRIIVDNAGYEYYDVHSEYYDEFLELLPKYAELCVNE